MKNTLTIEITKAYEVYVEATDIDMAFEEFLNTSYEKHLIRVYFPEPVDFKINESKKPKPKETNEPKTNKQANPKGNEQKR